MGRRFNPRGSTWYTTTSPTSAATRDSIYALPVPKPSSRALDAFSKLGVQSGVVLPGARAPAFWYDVSRDSKGSRGRESPA